MYRWTNSDKKLIRSFLKKNVWLVKLNENRRENITFYFDRAFRIPIESKSALIVRNVSTAIFADIGIMLWKFDVN